MAQRAVCSHRIRNTFSFETWRNGLMLHVSVAFEPWTGLRAELCAVGVRPQAHVVPPSRVWSEEVLAVLCLVWPPRAV